MALSTDPYSGISYTVRYAYPDMPRATPADDAAPRPIKRACRTCRHYEEADTTEARTALHNRLIANGANDSEARGALLYRERCGLGECRRRAPTLQGWPATYPLDRCGDHEF